MTKYKEPKDALEKYRKNKLEEKKQYLEQHRGLFERNKHLSLGRIAEELNRENFKTYEGYKWHSQQVKRALNILNISHVEYK